MSKTNLANSKTRVRRVPDRWTSRLSEKQVAELLVLLRAIARIAADDDRPPIDRLARIRRGCEYLGITAKAAPPTASVRGTYGARSLGTKRATTISRDADFRSGVI